MPADPDALGVYFLDVGQGDCTVIVPPRGEGAPILFDCADAYVAERFMDDHEITDLDAVVVSHLDLDHIRGILPFLRNHFEAGRRVRRLLVGLDRQPRRGGNQNLRALLEQALVWEREPPHSGFTLKDVARDGDGPVQLAGGRDWTVQLVLPWHGARTEALVDGSDANTCSAVLRVARGGTAFLIGGDAPLGSWERLEGSMQRARAIRAPHHGGGILEGGDRWTDYSHLYDAVGAEVGVISVGTSGGGYGHPLPAHVSAVSRGGRCRILCTQLTKQCSPEPKEVREEALSVASAVEWPYRHRARLGHPRRRPRAETPCAGTVVLALRAKGEFDIEPSTRQHERVIRRTATPLCQGSTRAS